MSGLTQLKNPKVTIVTVVFNASDEIETTLKSIISQSYLNKEIIVIDGGSTDGTIELVEKYLDKIDYFKSEKDNGIYDAMNKGIKYSSGDWICFMNAGDTFFSQKTIQNIFDKKAISHDILAGDCIADYKSFTKLLKVKDISKINYGMIFCHQAVIVRADIYREKMFDLSYKIASDFNFFYWCHLSNKKIRIYDFPFSIITTGGVSDTMKFKVILENRKILRQFSKTNLYIEFKYLLKIIWTLIKSLIESILPRSLALLIKKII